MICFENWEVVDPLDRVFFYLQGVIKALLKTWTELHNTFVRQAAMVPTAEPNVVCQELCALILEGLKEADNIVSYLTCKMLQFLNPLPYILILGACMIC